MRWQLRMQLFCPRSRISHSPLCAVCRQCTTCVRCGRCLSQFQICVCVSGLSRLLSTASQQLQSASISVNLAIVTKSLSSPAGASCQSKLEKKREQLCFHILNSHENAALRHNRYFNIATAQGCMKQCKFPSEPMRSAAVTQAFVPVGSL